MLGIRRLLVLVTTAAALPCAAEVNVTSPDLPTKSADEIAALLARAKADGPDEDRPQDPARGRATGEAGRDRREHDQGRREGDARRPAVTLDWCRPKPLSGDGGREIPGRREDVPHQVRAHGVCGGCRWLAGVPAGGKGHALRHPGTRSRCFFASRLPGASGWWPARATRSCRIPRREGHLPGREGLVRVHLRGRGLTGGGLMGESPR